MHDIHFYIGLILALFIGVTLGLIGSGGSILTVPILVYVVGIDPLIATAYSWEVSKNLCQWAAYVY